MILYPEFEIGPSEYVGNPQPNGQEYDFEIKFDLGIRVNQLDDKTGQKREDVSKALYDIQEKIDEICINMRAFNPDANQYMAPQSMYTLVKEKDNKYRMKISDDYVNFLHHSREE